MLSGARRRAAKGRLLCWVTAVVWRERQVDIAVSIWDWVRGVRVGGEVDVEGR